MTGMVIPGLGLLATFFGVVFFIGCFSRVDTPRFLERTGGDADKIRRLETLQDAWSRLGRTRQFVASSSALLIVGLALLSVWASPVLVQYYWVVPAALAVNLGAVLAVRRQALRVLDPALPGHAEALKVVSQNIRMCISFSIVFVVLAARA